MKIDYKILIISIISLLISIGLNAQIETKKKFFFDFRAGLNSSEMDIEDQNYGKKIKPGFHFALIGSYKFQKNLQIQSGIHVTKKGLKQKDEERVGQPGDYTQVIESYTRTTDANYILVPLMLGWESDYRKLWIFNVNIGGKSIILR